MTQKGQPDPVLASAGAERAEPREHAGVHDVAAAVELPADRPDAVVDDPRLDVPEKLSEAQGLGGSIASTIVKSPLG